MNTLKGAITWNELKLLLPVMVGLASIIFFIAGLSAKIDAVATQGTDTKLQIQRINDTSDGLKTSLAAQGQDIAIIKNILQHNGLTLAPLKPSPVIGTTTITYVYLQPTPTPIPTPEPTKKNPIVEFINKLKK